MGLTLQQFQSFIYWNEPDPVPDSVYASIAAQIHSGTDPAVDATVDIIEVNLRSRHVPYWEKNFPLIVNGQFVNWGDCGAPNAAAIPTGGLTAVSDVQKGIGAGVGVAAGAVTALGGTAAASAAGFGLLNAIPIVGTIAAIALLPFEIIFAHHAAAVAKEQGTNCSCWITFNQWLDAIDQAVASGQVSPADGENMVQQLYAEATTCVSSVSAACTPGKTNAACDLKGYANGQVLLRQWMYYNLPQFNPALAVSTPALAAPGSAAANPLSSVLSLLSGAPETPGAAGSSGTLILILLAILAAVAL